MTDGFKTGASSDDPLSGTDDTEEETDRVAVDDASSEEQSGARDTRDGPGLSADLDSQSRSSASLPWIYARDSITDGRDRTVQLHLQASTLETQTTVRSELEDRLDENIRLADLREAALLAGLAHTEDIASTLREWGYGIE